MSIVSSLSMKSVTLLHKEIQVVRQFILDKSMPAAFNFLIILQLLSNVWFEFHLPPPGLGEEGGGAGDRTEPGWCSPGSWGEPKGGGSCCLAWPPRVAWSWQGTSPWRGDQGVAMPQHTGTTPLSLRAGWRGQLSGGLSLLWGDHPHPATRRGPWVCRELSGA